MRLTLVLAGLELDITLGPAGADDEDEPAAALNGGTLTSERVEPSPGDRYMGFTGGWEGDGE